LEKEQYVKAQIIIILVPDFIILGFPGSTFLIENVLVADYQSIKI